MAPGAARIHSRPARLLRRQDFVRVQSGGRRFRRPHLVLLVDAGEHAAARVGYTISRKVGNSVVRNRVRRRLRELVRAQAELLAPHYDYVIIATPAAATADFATLRHEVSDALDAAARWTKQARTSAVPTREA